MRPGQISPDVIRIDAHHHLWHYTPEEYDWLQGDLSALQRDFLAGEFLGELHASGVTGAVAVQARQTGAETEWLLQVAEQHPAIAGVVGWLPISDPAFPAILDHFAHSEKLKGLRHIVQGEPAGFLDGTDFNRGIRSLADSGLVYDVLIHEHQLTEAIRFVDRHTSQAFVLDHLAKPRIAAQEVEAWKTHLLELAKRPHVACKLSGMVTEAGHGWTPALLKPYFEIALEAFTPARLMVGSDWPVLTPHCTYRQWWSVVEDWVAPLSADERADVLGRTAMRTYQLPLGLDGMFTNGTASM